MSNIALFGGSFDPPHLGHQLVISYVLGAEDVDEIWVIPTYKHALGKQLADFEHRYQMVMRMLSIFGRRALASRAEETIAITYPKYVDSRTITLVRHITRLNPEADFRLVIGSDLIEQAKTWDNWEEVVELAPPLIVGRIGHGDARFMLPNVSSTEIKNSLKDGSLERLVPKAVCHYIKQVELYGYKKL